MARIGKIWLAIFVMVLAFIIYLYYPESMLPSDAQINHLIVYKSKRQLLAFSNNTLLKTYTISLGRQPIGHKLFEGDNKTPEGSYYINDKNPNSICHKNLGISYPNKDDVKSAQQAGKSPGGDIKIHGVPDILNFVGKMHRWFDLSYGCIVLPKNRTVS